MNGAFELLAAFSFAVDVYQSHHGHLSCPEPGTSIILAFQNGLLVIEHQETRVQYFAYCCNTYSRLLKGVMLPPYAVGDAVAAHIEQQGEARDLQNGEMFAAVYPNLVVLCYEEDELQHARIYQDSPIVAMGKLDCFSPESETYLFSSNQRQIKQRGFVEELPYGHTITIVDEAVSENKHIFKFWNDESEECSLEIYVKVSSSMLT